MKKLKVIIYKRKRFEDVDDLIYCATLITRGYATTIDFEGDICTVMDHVDYNAKKHQFRIIQNDYECGFTVDNPYIFDENEWENLYEFEAYYKTK